VIILGSFPFRSMTLGESLTRAEPGVKECKTQSEAKFGAFLIAELRSLFFSDPRSLFWAEFLVA